MNVLLSIIIPTRNRVEYALSAIKNILKNDSNDFELVVQDNSDNDDLRRRLGEIIQDGRLHYNYTNYKLDVIANFDAGLKMSKGEFFTFIGDDDGVNPEVVDAAKWMKANHVDALTPALIVEYTWPDLRFKYYGSRLSGMLKVKTFSGKIMPVDVEMGMRESAREAFQNLVYTVNLPKVYYGIVRRSCIDELFTKTKTFFPGVSPDMAGAMGVASYVNRMYSIDYPLFVPGSSAKSTAGLGAEKKHHGRLEDQPHLPRECWTNWPQNVPKYFAVQTVWAQSGLAALTATGRDDILREFNLPLLYAKCMVFNPQFVFTTFLGYCGVIAKQNQQFLIGLAKLIYWYMLIWVKRVLSKIKHVLFKKSDTTLCCVYGVDSIDEAVEEFKKVLISTGLTLNKITASYMPEQDE